jgi:hypothetical protein
MNKSSATLRTGVIMILTFVIAGVAAGPAFAQSKEDAAVFDATLATFGAEFERTHHTAPKFLLFNETTVMLDQDLGFAAKDLPKQLVDALLVYNSVAQSLRGYSPPSPFRLATPVLLGPVLVIAKPGLARRHYYDWELLHTRFPDALGVIELTAPAYSPDASAALVYFRTGCGYDCATGYVYRLQKSNGVWKVVQTLSPWEA